MRTKTFIIIALAFAAGGTCPSDVNNDGTVGINDFLQVLGDWGPCPNASVVAYEPIGVLPANYLMLRLWSDNTLDIGVDPTAADIWDCAESIPHAGEWLILDAPPMPPNARPVDVKSIRPGPIPTSIFVGYSDGTAYTRSWEFTDVPPCDLPKLSHHREFIWVGEWTPFTGVLR